MWSVGVSVSPSAEAERLGYDERQINRIVVRLAQFFLDRDMRVIFGHDWREDGVMRAVADFAVVVAARDEAVDHPEDQMLSFDENAAETETCAARMLNVVPVRRDELSVGALEAKRESGGVLRVFAVDDMPRQVLKRARAEMRAREHDMTSARGAQLTVLRHWLTVLLNPGCRVCLGGRTEGYQGNEPGVMEEARLALQYRKPLYLMGGFGGATRLFGAEPNHGGEPYWEAENGLTWEEKRELFETTDVDRALRMIWLAIKRHHGPNGHNAS